MTTLRVLETLLSLSLQAALVVTATAVLARRGCRSDRGCDRLWTACFLAILLLCIGDFCLPHVRLLPVTAAWIAPSLAVAIERHTNSSGWLCALWLGGTIVMLGQLAVSFFRTAGMLRRSVPVPPRRLPEPWGRKSTAGRPADPPVSDSVAIRFLSTEATVSPFCWQLHCPTIVLPETVLSFTVDEIAAVIRHERAHLRFGHPLWLFVERLVEALLWFHPLVRWAGREASRTREFACDADAAPSPEAAASLLRSLLRLARINCCARARAWQAWLSASRPAFFPSAP